MDRKRAEKVATMMDRNLPGHYFAAHPELGVWAVFAVRPPDGKIEEVRR